MRNNKGQSTGSQRWGSTLKNKTPAYFLTQGQLLATSRAEASSVRPFNFCGSSTEEWVEMWLLTGYKKKLLRAGVSVSNFESKRKDVNCTCKLKKKKKKLATVSRAKYQLTCQTSTATLLLATDKCGGNVRISSPNYLTSPGYPMSYPPSQRCTWVISAPDPHQRILINFNPHFDLEDRECK